MPTESVSFSYPILHWENTPKWYQTKQQLDVIPEETTPKEMALRGDRQWELTVKITSQTPLQRAVSWIYACFKWEGKFTQEVSAFTRNPALYDKEDFQACQAEIKKAETLAGVKKILVKFITQPTGTADKTHRTAAIPLQIYRKPIEQQNVQPAEAAIAASPEPPAVVPPTTPLVHQDPQTDNRGQEAQPAEAVIAVPPEHEAVIPPTSPPVHQAPQTDLVEPSANVQDIKKHHKDQLAQFKAWEANREWKEIHQAHYDWWMFPVSRPSSGYKLRFMVEKDSEDLRALKNDKDFMDSYREGVALVVRAWGWDLEKGAPIANPDTAEGQGWDGYGVRLAKMGSSSLLFGEQGQYEKLKKFYKVFCLPLQEQDVVIRDKAWLDTLFNNQDQARRSARGSGLNR